ncbi:MAG TPA: SCO family protein [Actinocrinis sp.]|nr:SCO family protein [Actinocrinis sp.]
MRSALRLTALCAATTLLAATGCGVGPSTAPAANPADGAPIVIDSSAPASPFDGILLGKPFTKPQFTLTDASGQPFDFTQQTDGKLTLLYFGYTHCPDVCPTTMADIAAALRALPTAESAQISVVFVSTDPARDTPAVIHTWLAQFDPRFIGLTGAFSTIQQAATALAIPVSPPTTSADGDYTVTHGAEVLAFNTDDKAHVLFTAGTTVAQYDHDLSLLLNGTDMKSPQ